MCDTMVALGGVTPDGVTVFGKNSDREPNEAQYLELVPAAEHTPGARLRCTYIEIPQVPHTQAVLLSKPFWIWGAEMGANEHGLVIGNETVFSKVAPSQKEGLIGMDLLRLGLERATNALQGLEVIINLLEEYGQGGNCGFGKKNHYHNSFLIVDPTSAWILETVDRHWIGRQVQGVGSISNALSIGSQYDLVSNDLITFAQQKGWHKNTEDFDFSRSYSDFLKTTFGEGRQRCARSQSLLGKDNRETALSRLVASLRDHHTAGEGEFKPDQGIFGFNICAHAGFGPVRASQTTGSMAAYLHPQNPIYFLTGTSAPCTSIFKPVWLDAGLPDTGPQPNGTFEPETLFWQHERLHRAILTDYSHRLSLYKQERDELEGRFIQGALEHRLASVEERRIYSERCFSEAQAAEHDWLERISAVERRSWPGGLYRRAWDKWNAQASFK